MKHRYILVGAVAAMLAFGTGVRAQDAMPPADNLMGNGPIDYSLLADKTLDYTSLQAAKARGLTDDEVAVVAKIAEKTGMPFRGIADAVVRGETFAKLADMYNLKLQDVLDVKDEKMKIAAYEAAYQNTGKRGMGMLNSDMAMSGGMSNGMSSGMMMNKDIVATAMGDKRFSTLVSLLKKAGLVETLEGAGPFTVFAPTNAAFNKLPKDALTNLENNPDQLKQVLLYHVIPAKVDAATAMAMTSPTSPPTVEGDTLQVTANNGTVMVNNAKVVQADISATNGIIHAIDTVLMPSDMAMTPVPAPAQ